MDSRQQLHPPPSSHHHYQFPHHSMLLGTSVSGGGGSNHAPSSTHMIATPTIFNPTTHLPPHPNLNSIDDASSSPTSSSGAGKKKRGRPRKYATTDGNIALGLSPSPIESNKLSATNGDTDIVTPESSGKRKGRPPSSTKKQLDALGGVGGVGFTPHVITVEPGEDIASKIMAFSQQGPRTVCILSANGAISNITLHKPTTGGIVSHEGRFEIISLSGSCLSSENDGSCERSAALSVSVAGADGRVLGGGVAGVLKAASSVQVIVGSFLAHKKTASANISKSDPALVPQAQLNLGTSMTSDSPASQAASSNSSEENGGSPINLGHQIYNDASQPVQNMQMYHHLWAGQNRQ